MIVSIIIPCRNEEKYIRKTIDSIIGQDFNYEFEVIVVDGNSIDSTKEILYSYQKDIKNLIILDNPKKIVPISFNLGLNQSKGKYIIRVDAHSIIEKDFLKNCINVIDIFKTFVPIYHFSIYRKIGFRTTINFWFYIIFI